MLENFVQYAADQKSYEQLVDLISVRVWFIQSETKELNKDLNVIMGYGLTVFF